MNQNVILNELSHADPETVDVRSLLKAMDECLAQMSIQQQFAFAGTVLEQLAELEARKAELFAEEWEQFCNPTEPEFEDIFDPSLFVQSQQIRWDDELFAKPEPHYYPQNRKSTPRCGSIVTEATPEQLLEALATLPSVESITELAHAEDIEVWIAIVRQHLTRRMKLSTLQKKTGLAIVPLWIALLFGGFRLERSGDFYAGTILVSPAQPSTAIDPTDADPCA
jgi:hypothetical protein